MAVAILSVWRNLGQHGISGVMDWNKIWKLALFTAISVMMFLFILYTIAGALQIKNFKTMFFLTLASVLMVVIPNIIWNLIVPKLKK